LLLQSKAVTHREPSHIRRYRLVVFFSFVILIIPYVIFHLLSAVLSEEYFWYFTYLTRAIELYFTLVVFCGSSFFLIDIAHWLRQQINPTFKKMYNRTLVLLVGDAAMICLLASVIASIIIPRPNRTPPQILSTLLFSSDNVVI